ncbi:telomere length regulation protein TEL2 homolog [Microplitis demolitor]|uniref:telomere length regulation protein TEL2 homolog n=1 Tax=Microplitis demolitor TaxID=69319 RepID=UPI0004CCAAEE|nr:telomere length regulation protein TEL2 homolog [Microplitis demolitor]XP_053598017.1 telomere length regulation protein TEL2 homolog [Microplitis demolitor]
MEAAKKLLETLNSFQDLNNSEFKKLEDHVLVYLKSFPVIGLQNFTSDVKVDRFLHERIIEGALALLEKCPDDTLVSLVDKLIQAPLYPMLHESLQVLTDHLKKSTDINFINLITSLLEKIIKSETLYSSIMTACRPKPLTAIEQTEFDENWRNFLQLLVSLPPLIANKTQGNISKYFSLDVYSKIIIYHTARAVKFLNDVSSEFNITPNVTLISLLISKSISSLGSGHFVHLLDIFISWSLKNHKNIRELIHKILCNLERSSVEAVATLLLKRISNPSNVELILGNVLVNDHWRYVLTVKIPLLSCHDSDQLIKNNVFYLSSVGEKNLLVDLVIKMINIWGDKSFLNHSSSDHHEFISKFIVLSVFRLKDQLTNTQKEQIQRLIFDGTPAHLQSMLPEIRTMGMITGELIVDILSADAPKLKYDYDEAARVIVDKFKKLIADKDDEDLVFDGDEIVQDLGHSFITERERTGTEERAKEIDPRVEEIKNKSYDKVVVDDNDDDDDELDSDDDLIPYDMSNDTTEMEKLKPRYLRDLKSNLINCQANNDPDRFSESMKAAEELITKQLPGDDKSLGLELLKLLMTMKEEVHTENFRQLKLNSCVAIVLVYPKESAEFLCSSFHEGLRIYSVADRIFFLNVLAEAARKLSRIQVENNENVEPKNREVIKKNKKSNKISLVIEMGKKYETLYDDDFEVFDNDDEESSDWEEIVQRRIESKTRRFAHESKRPKLTVNKFNDVALHFFYPLLYGVMSKSAYLYKLPDQFVDTENILLIEFLKTLSTIMVAAENCVSTGKIARDLLELAWTLRYHEEAKVRLCVIENIAAVIISLKKENCSWEIVELLMESRAWLIDVSADSVRGDPNANCRSLGRNVVALIDSVILTFKNEQSNL